MTRERDHRLARKLIRWFGRNRRALPWRTGRTPYRVWVSEVMLQQTTADVVATRFDEFVSEFPDVAALARAPLARLLRAWSGLGYYRRARMLHAAARVCRDRFGGRLPGSHADLRSLPGVGDYTAAAVAAMGFGLPEPAVDGNVARVWSRFEAEALDPGRAADRRRLAAHLRPWIPPRAAGPFAEALIELGATVCRPAAPRCGECPIREGCLAFQRGEVDRYPAPRRRQPSVAVTSVRGVLRDGSGRVLVVRRPGRASLLAGFSELPGRWLGPGEDPGAALRDVFATLGFRRVRVGERLATARHVITRHRISSVAFEVAAAGSGHRSQFRFVAPGQLKARGVTTETRKLAESVSR